MNRAMCAPLLHGLLSITLIALIAIAAFTPALSAASRRVRTDCRAINLWTKEDGKSLAARRQAVMFMSAPAVRYTAAEEGLRPAVLICPGGSYHHLGMMSEGHKSAQWFNAHGAVTFVLRYRVAQGGYAYPAQREDAERAMCLIRRHADEWGIDAHRVGAIGYSAGGHLVTMLGAFATGEARPDVVMPIYPVVSMEDGIANVWSRKSLLGKRRGAEATALIASLSMEHHIPPDMPPVYLLACRDDDVVDFRNSERLYDALLAAGVQCHFAIYDWGGHGFGMKDGAFMKANHWNDGLMAWLQEIGFMPIL